jgi:hypothetical protein
VLGTTAALIDSRSSGVVATNLAGLAATDPRVVAHDKLALTWEHGAPPTAAEQTVIILYDDFVTSAVCKGSPSCGIYSTGVFILKHKQVVQAIWGAATTGYTIGNMLLWACEYVVTCEAPGTPGHWDPGDPNALGAGILIWTQDELDDATIPFNQLGEFELEMDEAGGFGLSLPSLYSGATYGYGAWGVVSELGDLGGGDPCEVAGPAAVKPATCD